MDGNRWLLGLILAFRLQVENELDHLKLAAEDFAAELENGNDAALATARDNSLASVQYIQRQCDTLARLRGMGPASIQPDAVTE